MASANVKLMRGFIEAVNTLDPEAIIPFCDPSIEYHSVNAAVGGGVYHGHDELRAYPKDIQDVWGEIRIEPEAFFDLGDDVLAFYLVRGRGKHSGADVEMPNAAVVRWRDGLMVSFKAYAHREDALSDLGVSEGDLQPEP